MCVSIIKVLSVKGHSNSQLVFERFGNSEAFVSSGKTYFKTVDYFRSLTKNNSWESYLTYLKALSLDSTMRRLCSYLQNIGLVKYPKAIGTLLLLQGINLA